MVWKVQTNSLIEMFRLATPVNNSNGQTKHTCMLSGLANVAEFTYGIVPVQGSHCGMWIYQHSRPVKEVR